MWCAIRLRTKFRLDRFILSFLYTGSHGAKISEGRGRPWGIFFGFYKTRHILLSDSANCTVPSF